MVNAIMGQFFSATPVIAAFYRTAILKIHTDAKNIAYTFARSIDNLY